jgi:hypothetical protein
VAKVVVVGVDRVVDVVEEAVAIIMVQEEEVMVILLVAVAPVL